MPSRSPGIPFPLLALYAWIVAAAPASAASTAVEAAVPVLSLEELADTTRIPAPGLSEAPAADTARAAAVSADSSPVAAPFEATGASREKGIILSAETGKPVANALVILSSGEERHSAQSDADGLYAFGTVKPGVYRLKVGKKGFAMFDLEGQAFAPGGNPVREIRLERSVPKGQMIEAKGGNNSGSSASMLAARRGSQGVMEGVGAEQIAKSTDSDAGAVARRLTGTSLVGGKYVYVRGLGERYTNMTLNGLPVPSPEKDKRVVPQDLFPASALEKFVLYKTFTPELNADFAGGSVALETKGIPEKRFLKASFGSGGLDYKGDGRFLGFGDERLSYRGGNSFWGYDDGTRSLPEDFPDRIPDIDDDKVAEYKAKGLPAFTRKERAELAMAFPNVHSFDTVDVEPMQNYSLSYGDVRKQGEHNRAGYILSLGFKNKYAQKNRSLKLLGETPLTRRVERSVRGINQVIQEPVKDTVPAGATADGDADTVFVNRLQYGIDRQVNTGTYEATLTGLANFGWVLSEDHSLFWKNLFANIATDEANYTLSRALQTNTGVSQGEPVEERYLLEFNRRGLYTSQLGGGHYLGFGPVDSAAWAAGYSWTEGETPDSRRHQYSRASDSAPVFEYRNYDIWGTRIFENLVETALAGRADAALSIPPAWSARDTFLTANRWFSHLKLPEARAGLSANYRNRDFSVTRYTYDADQGIYTDLYLEQIRDPKALKANIESGQSDFTTSPKEYDEYQAKEGIYGGYFTAGTSFRIAGVPFDADAGVRAEAYSLRLVAPFTGQSQDDPDSIRARLKEIDTDRIDLLPSAGLSATPYRNGKLRLQYSRTLARPEFREIAPFRYTDYLSGRDVYGNTRLRQTQVRHWDFRWEWFFPQNQLISVSLFDKDFADPVEVVSNTDKFMSYQNAMGAYVRGVEFEGNLDFDAVLGGLGGGWLKGLTAYGNLALMRSRVRIDTGAVPDGEISGKDLTSRSRSMMGQSPYLLNLKLSHERQWKRWGVLNALLFNVAGERIREVGVGSSPDIYEQPLPALDYLGKLTLFGNTELSWSIKNILGRDKILRGYEYHAAKKYYTVDPAFISSSFASLPTRYDTEVTEEGTSYEAKIAYGF